MTWRQRLRDAAEDRQPLVLLAEYRTAVAHAGHLRVLLGVLLGALLAWAEWRALLRPNAAAGPFAGAVGLFVMSYVGIAISLWPMIVPYRLALWQAASPLPTQAFLLVGTLFLLPVILRCTSSGRTWLFRGKLRADIGCH